MEVSDRDAQALHGKNEPPKLSSVLVPMTCLTDAMPKYQPVGHLEDGQSIGKGVANCDPATPVFLLAKTIAKYRAFLLRSSEQSETGGCWSTHTEAGKECGWST